MLRRGCAGRFKLGLCGVDGILFLPESFRWAERYVGLGGGVLSRYDSSLKLCFGFGSGLTLTRGFCWSIVVDAAGFACLRSDADGRLCISFSLRLLLLLLSCRRFAPAYRSLALPAAFSEDCEDDCELDMAIISSAALRLCGCGALYEMTVAVVVPGFFVVRERASAFGSSCVLFRRKASSFSLALCPGPRGVDGRPLVADLPLTGVAESDFLEMDVGVPGAEASVAYGDPGIGSNGCPR